MPDPQTILVVDDEPILLDSLTDTLCLQGFNVLKASNGLEALDILREQLPDLILADIMMPGMNGYQFYQRVRQNPEWLRIPFIFLTAKGESEDVRFGKELGADDYLMKPILPEDLIAAVIGRLERYRQLEAGPQPADLPYKVDLSSRELEVLQLMARGLNNSAIAEELFIGTATVKTHVSNILSKLYVGNRVAAVTFAIKYRLVELDHVGWEEKSDDED